jgi:hypothetical protein
MQEYKKCQVEDITGFVICENDGIWWLACVLQVNESEVQSTI